MFLLIPFCDYCSIFFVLILQEHDSLNYPPPQPEDGEVSDRAAAVEDNTSEVDPQGSEALESGARVAESSAEKSESSCTLSSPLSATSSKSKKRQRDEDEGQSSSSKLAGESTKFPSDALGTCYDFFGTACAIST